MAARVESPEGKFTLFKYEVKKLPTEIDVQQSKWKVRVNLVMRIIFICSTVDRISRTMICKAMECLNKFEIFLC